MTQIPLNRQKADSSYITVVISSKNGRKKNYKNIFRQKKNINFCIVKIIEKSDINKYCVTKG